MKPIDAMLYGMQCIIAPSIKRQVKTSRCKLMNWIYKKMYGYVEEPMQEQDIIYVPWTNQIVFKDKETFERVRTIISEVEDNEID